MVIQILGSAAGGGVPQWNCACLQCDAARRGLIEPRTQCSAAISADGRRWVLVNESPVPIYASLAIEKAVEEGLRITEVLNRYCGLRWVIPQSHFEPLLCRDGTES